MSEGVDTDSNKEKKKTEMPATMQPAKAIKRTKNAVEVFNGSSSKLAKLGGLIDYVGERIEVSDFIVVLGNGGPGRSAEIVPARTPLSLE